MTIQPSSEGTADSAAGAPETRSFALDIGDLCTDWPRLSRGMSRMMAEAASFCLTHCHHPAVATLRIEGDYDVRCALKAIPVTDTIRRTYVDLEEAVEFGAAAVAVLLIGRMTPYVVTKRSIKGPGFDYYLSAADDPLFQQSACLEVSGTMRRGKFASRVKEKTAQISISRTTGLTGFVVVVDFSKPARSHFRKHERVGAN